MKRQEIPTVEQWLYEQWKEWATYDVVYRCSVCGAPAILGDGPEDAAYCAEHPKATIDSVLLDGEKIT